MTETQRYLRENGIESLLSTFNIRACYHPDKNVDLVILNYTVTPDNTNTIIADECRGLVLELDTWNIIAKPFTRFYKAGVKCKLEDIDITESIVQSKEDGTLMILYNYRDTWRVNCIHNFADDKVRYGDITYSELFEETLGNTLQDIDINLDTTCTYLFEMCSIHNRVVRKYDPSRLYLLTVITNTCEELPMKDVNICASILGVDRPTLYNFQSINDMKKQLMTIGKDDITFEGFVIHYNGQRFKVKNVGYLYLHKLRFRGFPSFSKKLIRYFDNNMDDVLVMCEEFGMNMEEIEYRLNMYRNKIDDNRYHEHTYCDYSDYPCNEHNDGLANVPTHDGDKWNVMCTCGTRMNLIRLKKDHVVPSLCHCGMRLGHYIVKTGKVIYLCSSCNNTHEAHQRDIMYENEGVQHFTGEPSRHTMFKES